MIGAVFVHIFRHHLPSVHEVMSLGVGYGKMNGIGPAAIVK